VDVRLNNTSQLAGFAKRDDLEFFLKEICQAEYHHQPMLSPDKDLLDGYKKKTSSAGTEVGKGRASLGCLRPKRKPRLALFGEGKFGPKIRAGIDDGEFDVWVSVTDIRLYQDDHATPDCTIVEEVRRRLHRPGAVILSMGLTRAYAPSAEAKPLHWLQVNNIHLEDDPTWQLG